MQKKHLGRMLCSFALSALTLWGVSVTTAAKDARAALRSLREESLGVMLLRYERGDGGEEYLSMQTSLALRAAPLLRGEDERIAQAWSTELTQKPDDGAAGDAQRLCDRLADGAPGIEAGCRVLEDHLPRGLQIGAVRAELRAVGHVDSVEENMPRVRPVEVHDAARGGRLAGAGLTDEAENLPAANLKRDVVQRLDGDLLCQRKGMAHVLHIEQNVMFCHRAPPTGGVIFGARSSSSHVAAKWVSEMRNIGGSSSKSISSA